MLNEMCYHSSTSPIILFIDYGSHCQERIENNNEINYSPFFLLGDILGRILKSSCSYQTDGKIDESLV